MFGFGARSGELSDLMVPFLNACAVQAERITCRCHAAALQSLTAQLSKTGPLW